MSSFKWFVKKNISLSCFDYRLEIIIYNDETWKPSKKRIESILINYENACNE